MLPEDLLHRGQSIEVTYVVDGEQRIVECSDAAAAALGIARCQTVGQRCFEVVRGRGPFGRPACQPNCDAFRALQTGRARACCSLLVGCGPGLMRRLRCELFALPSLPGGALIRLQGRTEEVAEANVNTAAPTPHHFPDSTTGVIGSLAVLANLSSTLSLFSLTSFDENLGRVLDILRQAVGAESAEIFLAEREGGMLLSAYRGPFRSAFFNITRFAAGQGYPGLVLRDREPIATTSLRDDPRYLRTMVKEKGYQSYVCVPLLGPGGIVGSLNLAWRRSDIALEDALRLLLWASAPISTSIENSLHRLRAASADAYVEGWGVEVDLDRRLREFLREMVGLADASGAAMVLYEPGTGATLKRVLEGQPPRLVCVAPGSSGVGQCPALAEARGIALYGPKEDWPLACKRSPAWPMVTYCLPIVAQGRGLGMVQLGYSGRTPSPPTQYLRLLHEMAQGALHLAREAWLRQQSHRLLVGGDGESLVQLPSFRALPTGLPVHVAGDQRTFPSKEPAAPRLDVRCFGHFELYSEGRPVALDAFGRRAALTLLKVLLLRRGRPVAREALTELLWPEVDPEAGARRLYVTVHALRRALEPDKSGPLWTYVCTRADHYYFNAQSRARVDLYDFETHVERAREMEKLGNVSGAVEAYEAAATLYRGDLFEDEPYAEWCWDEREFLREQYVDVALKLAIFCAEMGRPDTGIEYCRRALRLDPLREEVHRQLMLSLSRAGRRTEALHAFQQLGVEPLPETKLLYESIKAGSARTRTVR